MITHTGLNVLDIEAELLINAANGKGWMGGVIGRFVRLKGVAESIHYVDPSIERLAKKEAKRLQVKCGDVFLTDSGKLGFPKGILHAVTMDRPGQISNLNIIESCLKNILKFCSEKNINTVAIPLLGTGTGKLQKFDVLDLYQDMLKSSNTLFNVSHYRFKK